MNAHKYNQYNKPKRCKCGGRPVDRVVSFPHYINIHCRECDEMLGVWREGRFIKPSEAGYANH